MINAHRKTADSKKKPNLSGQIGLRLSPELHAALEQVAAEEKRPLGQLCRIIVEEWLERRRAA